MEVKRSGKMSVSSWVSGGPSEELRLLTVYFCVLAGRKNWSQSWTVLHGGILTFHRDPKSAPAGNAVRTPASGSPSPRQHSPNGASISCLIAKKGVWPLNVLLSPLSDWVGGSQVHVIVAPPLVTAMSSGYRRHHQNMIAKLCHL